MVNRQSILIQNLVGLTLFSGVVKDKIIDILSVFGVSCSLTNINKQTKHWAMKRNATDEIEKTKMIKISIDNLNFKRKFAKTVHTGGHVDGRMLNLITSQVTQRQEKSPDTDIQEIPTSKTVIEEADFFLETNPQLNQTWISWCSSLIKNSIARGTDLATFSTTFVKDLEQLMPNFGPKEPDNVVFTRIEESQASSVEDVSKFLKNLKEDLKIGTEGFPEQCIVCGDQQTYSIIINLKAKFPEAFQWIIPMPGDWHLLKLAAETIRDMIWDGGLHDLAKQCGHHKEIHQ